MSRIPYLVDDRVLVYDYCDTGELMAVERALEPLPDLVPVLHAESVDGRLFTTECGCWARHDVPRSGLQELHGRFVLVLDPTPKEAS